MVLGDTAQHPAVFARHPDWQAAFDIDGDAAVATRKTLFDRAAADRMLVTGYHFPFPACGHHSKPQAATSTCQSSGRQICNRCAWTITFSR